MGRTRSASSDDIPIRDYIDALLTEMDKRNQQRFGAQEKAINAALASADKASAVLQAENLEWRKQANEWRGAMSDRDRELPSRREVDGAIAAVDARVRVLEDTAREGKGRSEGVHLSAGVVVGAITVTATVLGIIIILANVLTTS